MGMLVPGWSASQIDAGLPAVRFAAAMIAVQSVLYFQAAVLNVGGRFVLPLANRTLQRWRNWRDGFLPG